MEHFLSFYLSFSGPVIYLLVFVILLACGFGFPIPEDVTLFAAGYLAYLGKIHLGWMIGVAFLGVLLGDSVIFFLGYRYGRKITQKWFFKRLFTPERLTRVQKLLHTRGKKLIFAARFMPGLRAPIFFSAGTLHLPYRVFLIYNGSAACLSVPALIYTTYFFGHEIDQAVHTVRRIEHGIFIFILCGILFLLFKWYVRNRKKQNFSEK